MFHTLFISASLISISYNISQVQITKCLSMQFPTASHYCLLLRSKYHPQNPNLKHLKAHTFPWMLETMCHTIQKNRQNYSSVYILDSRCHQHISFLHITSTFKWINPVTLKKEAVHSSKMMNIWPQHSTEIQQTQSFHQCTYFDPAFHVALAVLSLQSLLQATCYILLRALKQFTTKPTLQPTQWCTHIGNTTTTLHLILHPGKCVIVRSHIRNDRLLIWTGLVHVWNRRLQASL
jgi:hypothetical protein